jgi:hypothetical protein
VFLKSLVYLLKKGLKIMTTEKTFDGCGFSTNNSNKLAIRVFNNYNARLKMLKSCAHSNINIVQFANNVVLTKAQCVQYMLNNVQINNSANAAFVAILQAYANKHINSVASVASVASIASITVSAASNANYNLAASAVNANATTNASASASASATKATKVASTKKATKVASTKKIQEFTL